MASARATPPGARGRYMGLESTAKPFREPRAYMSSKTVEEAALGTFSTRGQCDEAESKRPGGITHLQMHEQPWRP